jgi:histone acetyltransferase MYST1
MQRRPGEVYVHYVNTDKRMDEWVRESDCRLQTATPPPLPSASARRGRGRGRGARASTAGTDVEMAQAPPLPEPLLPAHPTENVQTERIISEEDYDLQHHKQLTAQRNFDMVVFDSWKIKPW